MIHLAIGHIVLDVAIGLVVEAEVDLQVPAEVWLWSEHWLQTNLPILNVVDAIPIKQ